MLFVQDLFVRETFLRFLFYFLLSNVAKMSDWLGINIAILSDVLFVVFFISTDRLVLYHSCHKFKFGAKAFFAL